MSVIINGMEIPKSCSECFAEHCIGSDFGCGIIGFEDGNTTCFTRERRKDCPLIEVPTPHGRLIDAEALLESIKEAKKKQPEISDVYNEDYFAVAEWVAYAPTVIEVEPPEREE